ncbi:NUMOD4 domain-containing protein [Sphingobium yanoikuyae]|uniref:NUMOD4 domain-containing protein n=1 Tax=Sphingobium yanoikuyae TaxID=13690 RepID=A0A430BZB2_SPHYA|nr:NUMOD4 domain-containing protein [Sphingobium yanoikuyae]RSU58046.1 hypothetical protein DAH51_07325 [Sphingobium yanoikuyae]
MEVWRPVAGYDGLYEVSNLGAVSRLDRVQHVIRYGKETSCMRSGGAVAAHPNKGGYLRVTLFLNGKGRDHFVQRLVCTAFHGPAPSPAHQAAHLDGDPARNFADNLEWKLPLANAADAIQHGTYRRGSGHSHAKLDEQKVREMRSQYRRGGVRFSDLAERFGVSHRAAFAATTGRTWKHVGE